MPSILVNLLSCNAMPPVPSPGRAFSLTRNRYVFAGVLCFILAVAGTGVRAMAGEALEKSIEEILADYRFGAEVRRSEVGKEQGKKRSALAENYAAAVEKVAEDFQKNGDLDSLLLARQEIDHVRKHQRLPDTEFPALASLRKIFNEQLSVINEAEAKAIGEWAVGEIPLLDALKVELTKANRLDDAVAIKREIDRLIANVAKGGSENSAAAFPAPAPASAVGEQKKITTSPITGESPVDKDLTLEAGIYDLEGDKATIGIRGTKDSEARRPNVIAMPGATLQNGELFVSTGNLTANGAYFKEMRLAADLGGTVTAENSLFQECTFTKSGGWVVKLFSSKWIFKNCVFSESFFKQWGTHGVGVQIADCTFIDVDFPEMIYREDAYSEARHEWMTIRNCEFVRCTVPESVLIATEDCVFTDCRFGASEYPANQPVPVTLFTAGDTSGVFQTSSNALTTAKSSAGRKSGSTLNYEYNRGELRLMAP